MARIGSLVGSLTSENTPVHQASIRRVVTLGLTALRLLAHFKMSSCHQSCVTCNGQDEASCTLCNSTFFLALQDIDKGYCISCSVETSVNGYVGIEGCLRCTLPSSTDTTPTCLECSELDYMVSIDGRSCVTSCGVGALPNYYTR